MSQWSNFDRLLTPVEKDYIYLVLPLSQDEDSVSVEEFLEHKWGKDLTTADLPQFAAAYKHWLLEGQPL